MGQDKQPGAGTPAPEWDYYDSPDIDELLKIRAELGHLKGGPPTAADAAKLSRRLSEVAARLGTFYLAVSKELLEAGEQFYNLHVEALKNALRDGGADADTIAAVAVDYAAALCGMTIQATPAQMKAALNACKPITAYKLDKYGAFLGLFCVYSRRLNALTEYTKKVKEQPDAGERALYFVSEVSVGAFTDLRAAALYWLQNIGYITADDFAGVDQGTIRQFLTYVDMYGTNGEYLQYAYIAKCALRATPEQLRELPPPRLFDYAKVSPAQSALNYADIVGEEIDLYLQRVAEQIEAAARRGSVDAPPMQNGTIEVTNPLKMGERIAFSEDYALILSRPLYASVTGANAREILPISAFIADYATHNPDAMKVTPGVLEKTVEAVNLLQQLKRTAPANGIYTLKTNLTEFSELYGYADANEQQKQEILTALHVLHNLYIVVWKPTGRVAVQLFGLQQYGLAGGTGERELILNVFASGFRGRPQFWNAQQYALIRKNEKGAAMRHFRHQIGSKHHEKEEDLLWQIFGYKEIREEVGKTNDAAQIAAANEYIRKHKSRDKKRLRGWFDDWTEQGYITYSVRANKKGEIIYSWKRLPACPQDPEETNE